MALPATAVGEVRTTGSDAQCGGFFNSARGGTDYSQQNSAQATGTVTSSTTTVTATTGIFTAAMVGNYITDGTTFKEITAYTDSQHVTVDSAPSWTGATIYVGGGLATPLKAITLAVGGNAVYIKSGTYSQAVTGTFPSGILVSGYASVHGDNPTGATRPIIQATAGSITLMAMGANVGTRCQCLILDANGQTSVIGVSGSQSRCCVRLCKAINCATGFSVSSLSSPVEQCESSGCTTGFSSCNALACYHSGGTTGFNLCGATFCISSGGTNGFIAGNSLPLTNCIAYGASSHGFSSSTAASVYLNCIASLNGGLGFSLNNSIGTVLENCAAYSNTSGPGSAAVGQVSIAALTADPFTNAAAGDFSLNTTAGGGAACRAAGIPGLFPGGLTRGYLDIGAGQHADPVAISGARLVGASALVG